MLNDLDLGHLTTSAGCIILKDIFHEILSERFSEIMRIMELARTAGASVDELRYMERKGFVNPVRTRLQRREVRQYQDADVRKVQLIIKYRRQGFTWDVAFQKAQRELANPPLFE